MKNEVPKETWGEALPILEDKEWSILRTRRRSPSDSQKMVFKTRKKFIWTKHCYGYLGLTAPGSIESGVVMDLNGAAWQLKIYSCIWAEAHFKRSTRGYLLGEALMKSFPNFLKTCMQKCFCILYSPLEPGRPPENKECSKRKLLCHWNTCIFALSYTPTHARTHMHTLNFLWLNTHLSYVFIFP